MTEKNPVQRLGDYGQSAWNDNLSRQFMTSGELERLIREDGIVGITSNPTIFDKAISESDDYDQQIKQLLHEGRSPEEIYDHLTITDIQNACDIMRPVYERSNHVDGRVSLEVAPGLASDTEATISEARRLFRLVDRPNVMIKIPGTDAGIPAIEQTLYEGININITLLFSLDAYRQVMEAYLRALERRVAEGKPVDEIVSVASFFVSRVDTEVDKRLQKIIDSEPGSERAKTAHALLGRVAIANARLAYQEFKKVFNSERFHELAGAGARIQRPLWASTSTKNPDYPDTLYIDELIGPNTVQTMTPGSIEDFRDHGTVKVTVEQDVDVARDAIATMESLGISYDDVIDTLVREGVEKFSDSYQSLAESLEKKCQAFNEEIRQERASWIKPIADETETIQQQLKEAGVVEALRTRDASFWSDSTETQHKISDRLGWLSTIAEMHQQMQAGVFDSLAEDVYRRGYQRVVLLGMGGSSLAPEVMATICPKAEGFPALDVLDTTHPDTIKRFTERMHQERTLFIVSSKSGTTIETTSLFKHFLQEKNGNADDFIVITDPGSPLEAEARRLTAWRVFANRPDIGGRYSALSYFGLVPAAAIGIDVEALINEAAELLPVHTIDHPGVWLGAALAAAHQAGRDKLTVRAAGSCASFGDWLEQLVAESTGKEGTGIVPIVKEPHGDIGRLADDRIIVHIGSDDDEFAPLARERRQAGHPVIEQRQDLAKLFLIWEIATAVVGEQLNINPFNEPNVQEAKDLTNAVLSGEKSVEVPTSDPDAAINALIDAAQPGRYIAIQAFVERNEENWLALQRLRDALGEQTHLATTLGYGPRYLHSTGQLHKGGPDTGLFLQIVQQPADDLPIPDANYSFGELFAAQADGDYAALASRNRVVQRVATSSNVNHAVSQMITAARGVETPAD